MGAGRPPDLQLPRPPRWSPWALVASVALHLAAVAGLLLLFVPSPRTREDHLLAPFSAPERAHSRQIMIAITPARPVVPPAARALPRPPINAVAALPATDPGLPATDGGGTVDSAPRGSPAADAGETPWTSLGSGLLWDRRLPAPTGVPRTHAELTDSAVKAIVNHYLDSLAALPGGGKVLPPSWKATIGGQEFGLDGQWITLAGVRIPSLILALIPLPNGGNESEALDKGAWMRAQDYELALPRQAAAMDRQEQITAIRERMAAEQELRRRQRVPPQEAAAE